ncbi:MULTISPECIES: DUF6730 family protein [Maribacter]|uniref:DUF6730 family protein n=1 Tax=Maribacter flavus TaxID=1658664 RepID=A0ABU7IJ69_9FLAO|nr:MULTISPECIES: DUF6730 family protein [Maribacter]MDC6405726.1 hypothetical protein [Maribacter sp. PR66]MEE1973022.1 DUF6730 family protein [Maribacter flavus]
MNKLETITQLLVNELTDFDKNVQQLSDQMERAESLRVKFDVAPIKGLILQLEELSKREKERSEHYLDRLKRNLKQAKIYPKWAVVTFMVFYGISLSTGFYAYMLKSDMENEKNEAFLQGERNGIMHLEQFLKETPGATKLYDEWRIHKSKK